MRWALVALTVWALAGTASLAQSTEAAPLLAEPQPANSYATSAPETEARKAKAETAGPINPQIDFAGFAALAASLEPVRAERRVSFRQFMVMAAEGDTLLLDARSSDAYARGHISGAVNLPFTDFTAESLARVIGPDRSRRILIYCNNNFSNNVDPVVVKGVKLALNVPTFINLYGYGYPNIYELADVVDFNDAAVRWVTSGKRY